MSHKLHLIKHLKYIRFINNVNCIVMPHAPYPYDTSLCLPLVAGTSLAVTTNCLSAMDTAHSSQQSRTSPVSISLLVIHTCCTFMLILGIRMTRVHHVMCWITPYTDTHTWAVIEHIPYALVLEWNTICRTWGQWEYAAKQIRNMPSKYIW